MWTADWVVPLKGCLNLNCFLGVLLRKWRCRGGNGCRLTTRASCVGLIMVMILLLPCFSFTPPAGTEPQPAEFAIVRLGGPPAFSSPALLAADYTLASRSSAWLCSFSLLRDYHTHIHAQHTRPHTKFKVFWHNNTETRPVIHSDMCGRPHIYLDKQKCAHRHVWHRL